MKTNILLILLLSIILSCSNNKTIKDKDSFEIKKINLKSNLINEYNIGFDFDTLRMELHSIDFDKIINTEKQIITQFYLLDIYTLDDDIFLKIEDYSNYLFLKISPELLKKIRKDKNLFFSKNIALVIKIKTMKKIDFILETIIEEEDSFIDLGIPTYSICKGEVIDLRIISQ